MTIYSVNLLSALVTGDSPLVQYVAPAATTIVVRSVDVFCNAVAEGGGLVWGDQETGQAIWGIPADTPPNFVLGTWRGRQVWGPYDVDTVAFFFFEVGAAGNSFMVRASGYALT